MQRLNNKRRWIATQPAVARNDGQEKEKGFTLVELVITIAIVIILSIVSVPIYQGYTKKAKLSEGYALLALILTAQKNYYSEYGNFLHSSESSAGGNVYTCNDEVLGIDARGNKYFTYFKTSWGEGRRLTQCIKVGVAIPNEIAYSDKVMLGMVYNITTGATYIEDTILNRDGIPNS